MIKNFSISVYVIPFIFAVITFFFDQFDWFHTFLLFCLALSVDVNYGKKYVLYSKTWPEEEV